MKSVLNYVTYQTFPAKTANSLQTITNIKYLIRNGIEVNLYFPMREDSSSDSLTEIQNFYQINESFKIYGSSKSEENLLLAPQVVISSYSSFGVDEV